ncbi:MAG: molybdate ABC transporter substrate-binding protein [Bacteroidota bacterium]
MRLHRFKLLVKQPCLSYIFLLTSLLSLSACQQVDDNTLFVATAANVQFAAKQIANTFTQQTGQHCELIIASSGQLTAQIEAGAPYHVFLAADMQYPRYLDSIGRTLGPPKKYALGYLTLWTRKPLVIDSTLNNPLLYAKEPLAIANPQVAPYGRAALEALQAASFDLSSAELIYGESITQVNHFIQTEAINSALTATSASRLPKLVGKGYWYPLPSSFYQPIEQGYVIIQDQNNKVHPAAVKFGDYLHSLVAKDILAQYGYRSEVN